MCRNRNLCNVDLIKLQETDNISVEERASLSNLKNNENIVIKQADKGGATVILDKVNYINEAYRQLSNTKYYKQLTEPTFMNNVPIIIDILQDLKEKNFITREQFLYLSGPRQISNRTFYLLPKIHKKRETWPSPRMPEGRPIVSDVNSETYRVSEYLDHFIKPLSIAHKSYIKNSYEFVNKIRNFALQNKCLLVTGDVTSLYTNMNIDRTLSCVKTLFDNNRQIKRPDKHLLKLLEVCLRNNDFSFNGKFYLQTTGIAMGKRFAPSLADIYLTEFDETAMNGFHVKPLLYFRYLDDVFFLWPSDLHTLKQFETFLNAQIPDIKITFEHSDKEINFLDTTIYIDNNNTLQTKVFFKSTDTHQLLHKKSFHPQHTFAGILKSQFIRFKRLSSTKLDYDITSRILISVLKNRGYPVRLLRSIKNKIWFTYDENFINTKPNVFPIVVDFCSFGKQLAAKYKTTVDTLSFLNNNKPVIAYKNSKNLKQILIRSKLSSNSQGAFRGCGASRCNLCRNHAFDAQTFKSNTTNKSFKIKDNLTCSSTNIIYLITCNSCNVQYVGETGCTLRERFTNHKSNIKLKKQTPIAIHFNSASHSILDLNIIAIDKISDNNVNIESNRKLKEKYWQNLLQTNFPKGLNGFPVPNK